MMAKNIKDDPDDNFDNMDIPAVNFFVTQPALHYALSWWKFWLFEGLMHHITNNHKLPTNQSYQSAWMQTYELSRPAGSGRASNQPIIQSIKPPTNQTTNKSTNQVYLNTDIWTVQVCREVLDKTMVHRFRRCSRLTRHSTWVSIIIMRKW